jgi:adenylylsulfate reductase subunit A
MSAKLTLAQIADEIIETDALIVGGGLAGAVAAIRAREKGNIDVVLIEKTTIRRGSVGGQGTDHFAIAHPKINNITPEQYVDYTGRRMRGFYNRKVILAIRKYAIKTLALLESIGVNITEDNNTLNMIPGYLGSASGLGTGRDFCYYRGADLKFKLEAEVHKRGIRVFERTILTSLIKRGDSVIGATAFNYRTGKFIVIKAKATLIATGGPYRLYQHKYATFPSNMWVERINPWDCCGGHATAYRAGAKLINMEFIMVPIFPAGLANVASTMHNVMKNQEGENLYEKFSKLDTPRSKGEPGIGWASYPFEPKDNPEIERSIIWFNYDDTPYEGELQWAFTSAQESTAGLKLFRERGGGKGDPIELAIWIHGLYRGLSGISLDENGESSLKGLFAAGDVANGGTGTAVTTGAGYMIGDYIRGCTPDMNKPVFGEEQISQVKQERERVLAPLGRKDGVNPLELNDFVNKRADELIGIKKNEPKLKRAIETFEVLQKKFVPFLAASDFHELMRALEVQDILEISNVHAHASLIRKETRMYPSHYRVDYPKPDDANWQKAISIHRQDGKLMYTLEKMD